MFNVIAQARKRAAHQDKRSAVGANSTAPATPLRHQQTMFAWLPGWLRYLQLPTLQTKWAHLTRLGFVALTILVAYHLHPVLTYSEWFQPVLTTLGYAAFVLVFSVLYGIYWTITTNVALRYTLLHSASITLASAVIATNSGLDGGTVGWAISTFLDNVHPAVLAASATLLFLYNSIYLGNPMVKVLTLSEQLIDLFYAASDTPTTKQAASRTGTAQQQQMQHMQTVLDQHGLDDARIVHVLNGPLITTYEIQLPTGKTTKALTAAKNSLARATKAISIRIIEQLPGKSTCAIELVTKDKPAGVEITTLVKSRTFKRSKAVLRFTPGVDSYGNTMVLDMHKLPHLLIAGTSGAGKSVTVRSLLYSLLLQQTPERLKLVLIDPKKVELSAFAGSPFLLHPVMTDMENTMQLLGTAVQEMEHRYTMIEAANKQNLREYNHRNPKPLPWLVIVIEEAADLIMQYPEVESLIVRLAQKARGAGIHLVVGTQYPTTQVLTSLIKANIAARFGLMVSTKVESRVILDQSGGETLHGNGDMYAKLPGHAQLLRIHGANVSQHDIQTLVRNQQQQFAHRAK